MSTSTPAHQALKLQSDSSLNRSQCQLDWRCQPDSLRGGWMDQQLTSLPMAFHHSAATFRSSLQRRRTVERFTFQQAGQNS